MCCLPVSLFPISHSSWPVIAKKSNLPRAPWLNAMIKPETFLTRFLWRQWKLCQQGNQEWSCSVAKVSAFAFSSVTSITSRSQGARERKAASQILPSVFRVCILNKAIDLYQYNSFVTNQNRNTMLRPFFHYITKSKVRCLSKQYSTATQHRSTSTLQSPGGSKFHGIPEVFTIYVKLSLLWPGSPASLTGIHFKWNYTVSQWKGQSLCAALPLLLSFWPSRRQDVLQW